MACSGENQVSCGVDTHTALGETCVVGEDLRSLYQQSPFIGNHAKEPGLPAEVKTLEAQAHMLNITL